MQCLHPVFDRESKEARGVFFSENQTKGKCEEKYKYKESDYVNGGQEQDEMCFPSVGFNDVARLLRGNRHSGVCHRLFIWPACLRPW